MYQLYLCEISMSRTIQEIISETYQFCIDDLIMILNLRYDNNDDSIKYPQCFISGGSALQIFQNEPILESQDLDIFISKNVFYKNEILIDDLLKKNSYVTDYKENENTYYDFLDQNAFSVINFKKTINKEQVQFIRKLQFILIPTYYNQPYIIPEEVVYKFDLNISQLIITTSISKKNKQILDYYHNTEIGKYYLLPKELEYIKNKNMFIVYQTGLVTNKIDRIQKRLIKYMKRGYILKFKTYTISEINTTNIKEHRLSLTFNKSKRIYSNTFDIEYECDKSNYIKKTDYKLIDINNYKDIHFYHRQHYYGECIPKKKRVSIVGYCKTEYDNYMKTKKNYKRLYNTLCKLYENRENSIISNFNIIDCIMNELPLYID